MRLLLIAVVAAGIFAATLATAQDPRFPCSNTSSTCSGARNYGLAWCDSGKRPTPPAECKRRTRNAYARCMKDGTWVTTFCNRSGLTKQ
jgi:hypothetical protein